MKSIFTILFLLICMALRAQVVIPDSAAYVRKCDCECSAGKYRDIDRKVYQVFLDRSVDEIFILRRRSGGGFVREVIKVSL